MDSILSIIRRSLQVIQVAGNPPALLLWLSVPGGLAAFASCLLRAEQVVDDGDDPLLRCGGELG
ncbi:hypothetical protein AB0I90_26975 [Micromonospora wenchangensis]|uniref:hypothetical protein n=1 Tax=Micromonospora wenchangensis TaxID=1185415 RepID=UPI003407CB3D